MVITVAAVVIVTFVSITSHEDVHVNASRNSESIFAFCFNVDCGVTNTFLGFEEDVHVVDEFIEFVS